MRDLLYLSNSKMRALMPQLPDRVRKRLTVEAGVNTGVVSVKASLANDASTREPSPFEALGPVIDMIKEKYGERSRHDVDLRVGDWIKLDEAFLYGRAASSSVAGRRVAGHHYPSAELHKLVYVVAEELPPLVLLASGYHFLDRRQPEPSLVDEGDPGRFYMEALHEEFRSLQDLDGSGAVGALPTPDILTAQWPPRDSWIDAVNRLCSETPQRHAISWMPLATLAGHARVLAVGNSPDDDQRPVLATPLYLEYAPR